GRRLGVPGEGRAAEVGLQAARVAARADRAVVVDAYVPDVAGAAGHAAVDGAVHDDAAADAGADLDEEEVAHRAGQPGVQLAQRHQVHVVVDEDGAPQLLPDRVADGEPVPAGHDRRDDRHAVAEADRPGDPDPGAVHLRDQPLVAQLAEQVEGPFEDHGRALPDVALLADVPDDLQGAVGHRDVDRGGADVERDEPQPGRQPDDPGPPPAPGRGQPRALHE